MDYRMIEDGDKIAVAVSGGKDSLSLLHVLRDRQRVAPVRFQFVAVHIDFGFPDFSPEGLLRYLRREGFACLVRPVDTLREERYQEIDCFRWSRERRKALFQLVDEEGFDKIAFGHHMDDIVETILLNQFYRGEIGAMKPVQELFGGKVVIIRPLAYEREHRMERLARELNIHAMGQSKCANDETSHRMLIKRMLREFERHNSAIVTNIFNSLRNIRTDYLLS